MKVKRMIIEKRKNIHQKENYKVEKKKKTNWKVEIEKNNKKKKIK